MPRERLSNFELLRIVAMALIVTHHYAGVTPWQWDRSSDRYRWFNEYFANVLSTTGKIGVNLFLMLTGYFLNGKPIKPSSVARTWIQAAMWSYTFFIPTYALSTVQQHEYRLALLPIVSRGYWFVSGYIVAMCCSGWIATVARESTPMQYISGLGGLFTLMSLLDWSLELTYCNNQWFLFAMAIGAFVRRYSWRYEKIRTRSLVVALAILSVVNLTTVYVFTFNEIPWAVERKGPNALMRENWSVLALAFAIVLFILFMRVNVKSSTINTVAEQSLGVYLIHENVFVSPRLWREWVCGFVHQDSLLFPAFALIQIALVYMICTILEYLRQLLFGWFEEKVAAFVGRTLESLADWVNESFSSNADNTMV